MLSFQDECLPTLPSKSVDLAHGDEKYMLKTNHLWI